MAETYSAAFAPGTLINRLRQAKLYLTFMFTHDYPYMYPSVLNVLLYTQFLANSFKNTTTIRSYISGAKTFVTHAGGDISSFASPHLSGMLRGVARISLHIPEQAPPIPLPAIKAACDILAAVRGEALVARTAILVGFASLLRQSNLLPSTANTHCHTVTRADMLDEGEVLWTNINSSKTISDARLRVSIPVPYIGSKYCPVTAWHAYIQALPLPSGAPAFMLTAAKPLTANRLNCYLRTTLTAIGLPQAARVTVHSLRRSGVQECARRRALEAHLMAHGTWASQAIMA